LFFLGILSHCWKVTNPLPEEKVLFASPSLPSFLPTSDSRQRYNNNILLHLEGRTGRETNAENYKMERQKKMGVIDNVAK
jgi:hypothetical protein